MVDDLVIKLADEDTAPAALELGLIVQDIDAAIKFYRDALGCRMYGEFYSASGLRLVALLFGSSMFKLCWREEPPNVPASRGFGVVGYQYMSFRVTDIDAAFSSAVRAGAKAISSPNPVTPACVAAILEDPEGNLFELVEGGVWGAGRPVQ